MSNSLPAMPWHLARRPRHGALPVPFTTAVRDDVPDFKFNDPARVLDCAHGRRCALCGAVIDGSLVFIAGPGALEVRLFPDPPAHEACIRYAICVCPFLLGKRGRRVTEERAREMDLPHMEHTSEDRPDAMYLAWTKRYRMVLRRETGVWYFEAAPFWKVEDVSAREGQHA